MRTIPQDRVHPAQHAATASLMRQWSPYNCIATHRPGTNGAAAFGALRRRNAYVTRVKLTLPCQEDAADKSFNFVHSAFTLMIIFLFLFSLNFFLAKLSLPQSLKKLPLYKLNLGAKGRYLSTVVFRVPPQNLWHCSNALFRSSEMQRPYQWLLLS